MSPTFSTNDGGFSCRSYSALSGQCRSVARHNLLPSLSRTNHIFLARGQRHRSSGPSATFQACFVASCAQVSSGAMRNQEVVLAVFFHTATLPATVLLSKENTDSSRDREKNHPLRHHTSLKFSLQFVPLFQQDHWIEESGGLMSRDGSHKPWKTV